MRSAGEPGHKLNARNVEVALIILVTPSTFRLNIDKMVHGPIPPYLFIHVQIQSIRFPLGRVGVNVFPNPVQFLFVSNNVFPIIALP